ncbi:dihydropteroate synthase [Dinoroseobacter sp. PD6]|uniref:dihydropteroate synthase n=1 Tax=Dinoroseobacter sp. PD6 TaxID=3028384 RepID=UPI00237A1983|nr:dihydropteroate synthase [Dinoroseobacter sp. PD6]MDD9716351.1 dihydropteroate synthase [Dinoroseobacter sp. PD6]
MSRAYYRPIPTLTPGAGALRLAGGWVWCDRVEVLRRDAAAVLIPAGEVPAEMRARLTAPRAPVAGVTLDRPRLMGILNTTPDSFSDGGRFDGLGAAVAHAGLMRAQGAEILDIGGESTRPGAREIPVPEEIERTAPVIAALRAGGVRMPISIDTRKAAVAAAALDAGADMINDVSAFGFDPEMGPLARKRGVPACLMHARGAPETMQNDPRYDAVLLDVYDALEDRIAAQEAAGLPRSHILADPGIGFGKTLDHNLALLRGLSLFHGLGCAILLGASRKSFIGTLSATPQAADRVAGSVAVALHGAAQGVQVLRVHDVEATRQALALWAPLTQIETG